MSDTRVETHYDTESITCAHLVHDDHMVGVHQRTDEHVFLNVVCGEKVLVQLVVPHAALAQWAEALLAITEATDGA